MERDADTPDQIDQYHVLRRIGAGGAAETFEVLWIGDDGTEGRGCLKRLHAHRARERKDRTLFAREARIAGHLHHGNLCGIVDHNLEAERPYVVFEYVDGVDVRALARSKAITPAETLWIGNRVAAALHYAHSFRAPQINGVVHRDVTPGNILVSLEGDVKLADFGQASFKSDDQLSVTMEGPFGTLQYVAPEVAAGKKGTEASDIYGLGAVLYELAVGQPPVEGNNPYELLTEIADGAVDFAPLESAEGYSPEFVALIRQMLARDPLERPTTAREVQLALQRCGAHRGERKTLGQRVEQIRAHEAVTVRQELEPDSANTRPTVRTKRPEIPTPKRQRFRPAMIAAIAAIAAGFLLGTSGVLGFPADQGLADVSTAPKEPSVEEVAVSPRMAPSPEGSDVVTRDELLATLKQFQEETDASVQDLGPKAEPPPSPTKKASRTGQLTIVAEPWGHVWIDGKRVGTAPHTARLRPGRHKIQVGETYPEAPKYVRVGPGSRDRVFIKRAEVDR